MSGLGRGDTYFGPLKHPKAIPHLWFIITHPDADGQMVAVNMTDYENHQGDVNCVLEIGEHPRIHKRSVVRYCDAMIVNEDKLQSAELLGFIVQREPAGAVLLERIRHGALTSDDMSPRLAKIVKRDK